MTIDKSLRQNYQVGKKVDAFKEGFKTIAGKSFAPYETNEEKTGTFDLGSMVESQAKSYATKAILGKLGLGSLFPYIGIASWVAKKLGWNPSDLMQGFAPGLKTGQKQTQAQYEAARAARQTQSRIDSMLGRKAAGKSYSQKVLNELTMGSKPGFYGNVPTVSRVNIAKNLIGMPENLGDRGSISPPPTGLVNPIQQARDAQAAKDAKAAKDAAIKEAVSIQIGTSRGNGTPSGVAPGTGAKGSPGQMAKEAAKSRQAALERGRGGVGRGGGGYGGDPGGGAAGSPFAHGGRIGKPLPGRNRYL